MICVEKIAGLPDVAPMDTANIPGCTYCRPQVASVGLTEAAAKAAGHEVRVGRFPFIGNGKAIALGEPEGMVKTVFDARTGELLGAHMAGPEVTEMIQGYTIARTLETTETELMHTRLPAPDHLGGDARGGAGCLWPGHPHLGGRRCAGSPPRSAAPSCCRPCRRRWPSRARAATWRAPSGRSVGPRPSWTTQRILKDYAEALKVPDHIRTYCALELADRVAERRRVDRDHPLFSDRDAVFATELGEAALRRRQAYELAHQQLCLLGAMRTLDGYPPLAGARGRRPMTGGGGAIAALSPIYRSIG